MPLFYRSPEYICDEQKRIYMKTVVEVDYKWSLNSCLRYARRQVLMIRAFKEKKINPCDVIEVIRECGSVSEAENRLISQYEIAKVVAREIMETPLSKLTGMYDEEELEYYTKATEMLSVLMKEITDKNIEEDE